jgi:D-alanyl-D-alanine carboxypeptidase
LKRDHPSMRKRLSVHVCFAGVFAIVTAVHPAAARHAQHHASHGAQEARHSKHESAPAPPYAAIVLDANSGRTLHADQPDELRHPASLTKIMTLYLLFERLDAGKIRLDSQLPVSEHASIQAPTKLGLKPGQSLEVEDAIRGMVTKSANDAAVAVAEALGGGEREFADMMTAKAHALGMSRTIYHNASGLPNDEQVTTARDQALLGRAIAERFPRYYQYFATPSFTYRGQTMRNHNQLLGHVEGMDGIKTGYTQASGFNLVASVRRDNRHIVSVVMGGTSAGSRDARMRSLIEEYIVAATPQKTMIAAVAGAKADAARKEETRTARARAAADPTAPGTRAADPGPSPNPTPRAGEGEGGSPASYSIASASYDRPATLPVPPAAIPGTVTRGLPAIEPVVTAPTPPPYPPPQAGESKSIYPPPLAGEGRVGAAVSAADPIKPIQVKTVKVKMAPAQIAALAPAAPPAAQVAARDASPDRLPPAAIPQAAAAAEPRREPARDLIAEAIRATTPPESAAKHAAPPAPSVHYSGWTIQVGAFDVEREARDRLNAVQAKVGQKLKHASPFTEAVVTGDKTFYRARFAGIQKDEAEAICRQLKRNDIACMTIKN